MALTAVAGSLIGFILPGRIFFATSRPECARSPGCLPALCFLSRTGRHSAWRSWAVLRGGVAALSFAAVSEPVEREPHHDDAPMQCQRRRRTARVVHARVCYSRSSVSRSRGPSSSVSRRDEP